MKNQFKISFNTSEEGTTFTFYIGKSIISNFSWNRFLKGFAVVGLVILTLLGKIDWKAAIEVIETLTKTV